MKASPYQQIYSEGDLCLLDAVNLAKCAAERARSCAGQPGNRFTREYTSALLWSTVAASYKLCSFY